jgi:VanZ family protein
MFRKLFILAAWVLLALIVYVTVSPIHQRPTPLTSSSVEHLAAFLVLGVLFCLGYPRRLALMWLIVLGSAVLLELLQLVTPDRHARIADAIEKMAGGAFGILVGRAMLYFEKVRRVFTGEPTQTTTDGLAEPSCLEPTRGSIFKTAKGLSGD